MPNTPSASSGCASRATSQAHHLHSAGPARPENSYRSLEGRQAGRAESRRLLTITPREVRRDRRRWSPPILPAWRAKWSLARACFCPMAALNSKCARFTATMWSAKSNGGMLGRASGHQPAGRAVAIPALTEKDKLDLQFGLKHGVDVVALSFVRSADDIRMAKSLMRELGQVRARSSPSSKSRKPSNTGRNSRSD